jgi:hypothetical protein
MNNPNHFSESLETIFWVEILKFFDAHPGWEKFGSGMWVGKVRIGDKHPGSATLGTTAISNLPLIFYPYKKHIHIITTNVDYVQ